MKLFLSSLYSLLFVSSVSGFVIPHVAPSTAMSLNAGWFGLGDSAPAKKTVVKKSAAKAPAAKKTVAKASSGVDRAKFNAALANKKKESKSISRTIFDMDLFAPKATQNDYGARSSKKLSLGKIGSNSYVPAGMSASQYAAVRSKDKAAKDANYKRNVAKAGKFEDYTEFYTKRGTDTSGSWKKSVTLGHRMAKTKYDFGEGSSAQVKGFESTVAGKRAAAKTAAKKTVAKKR